MRISGKETAVQVEKKKQNIFFLWSDELSSAALKKVSPPGRFFFNINTGEIIALRVVFSTF